MSATWTISFALLFVVTSVFIGLFVKDPWYRSPFGTSVMVLAVGLDVVAGTFLFVRLVDPFPGAHFVILGGIWAVTAAMAQRTYVLAQAQRADR